MRLAARHLLLGLALFGAGAASAQVEPPVGEPFRAEIAVTEVLLDVIVSDRGGTVVLGLGVDDFEVTENGEPVELLSATFYSHRVPETGTAAALAGSAGSGAQAEPAAPVERYLILFLDDQRERGTQSPGLTQNQIRAGRDVREGLPRELTPQDWVAVVGYDKKLLLFSDFTRDRAAIDRAVEAATTGGRDRENWPSRQNPDPSQPSLARALPTGDALRDQTGTIYEALTLVADAAAPIVGRKNLILLSGGFGRVNRTGLYEPDPRYYDPMVEALNDSNVAVYALDLTPPGTEHTLAGSMTELTSDTGGRYYREILHFATPISQVSRETSGYYLLAYRATHPAGLRGFQEVGVRLKNPELRVKSRKGYLFGD